MCESDCASFDHPVYKKLSKMNGQINKMNKQTLQKRLSELNLHDRGVVEVLRKRLKNHNKRTKLAECGVTSPREFASQPDFLLVIDFEATCEADQPEYNHEIIEFPVILVDVALREIVDEFHAFVRPCVNPRLTAFCTDLTGITQVTVDGSEDFTAVLGRVNAWMKSCGLLGSKRFAVITDGSFDMARFMANQCRLSAVDHPSWASRWVNVRKVFSNSYLLQRRNNNLAAMLTCLELTFAGTPHSGRDDARNIARVCIQLLQDGVVFKENELLGTYPPPVRSADARTSAKPARRTRAEIEETSPVGGSACKKRASASVLEKSLDILAQDRDNGASPDDLDMLRQFCNVKLL